MRAPGSGLRVESSGPRPYGLGSTASRGLVLRIFENACVSVMEKRVNIENNPHSILPGPEC